MGRLIEYLRTVLSITSVMLGLLLLTFLANHSTAVLIYPETEDTAREEWTVWSSCSVTCGNGFRYRYKGCRNIQKRSIRYQNEISENPDNDFEFIQNDDNIHERKKPCTVQLQTRKCNSSCTVMGFPYVCHFNNGMCDMTQDIRNDFDWIVKKSDISNDETNETSDIKNTFMRTSDSYLSTDSTNFVKDEGKSRIITPWLSKSADGYCLEFWYNLNGIDVKFLKIYVQVKENKSFRFMKIWEREGDHGDFWLEDSASFSIINKEIRIIFEATAGRVGNISLDDVTVKDHVCVERRKNTVTELMDK